MGDGVPNAEQMKKTMTPEDPEWTPEDEEWWEQPGARAETSAREPKRFIEQLLAPLFFRRTSATRPAQKRIRSQPTKSELPIVAALDSTEITSERQFWNESGNTLLGVVRLSRFRLTDWFPRAPGVCWSDRVEMDRDTVSAESHSDAELGQYFSVGTKMGLIEQGGVGTIRLRPRRIDEADCWLGTALTGVECHRGIPVLIPDVLLRSSGVSWGEPINIVGRVRFLQDAGLDDIAAHVHHARPIIVFVDRLEGVVTKRKFSPIVITPTALFVYTDPLYKNQETGYVFATSAAGSDSELDAAADWIERYATKHGGRIITNFDEQRPVLAGAPMSYQRLVAKTYDQAVAKSLAGRIHVDRIDRLVQESITNQYYGDFHVENKIKVGGSAIVNIESSLSNVTQTIGSAPGLDQTQKSQLDTLVQSLEADLQKLKASHADEAKEIVDALEKAVANAAKPPHDRKASLLQLSAKGLKEAAELVKDIVPTVLSTADLIAKFIVGL
jgi:hypothetical protein